MKTNNKILFIISILLFSIASCNFKEQEKKLEKTNVRFKDSVRHYFAIPQDKKLDVPFKYFNTGNAPLAILEVQSSCGCAKVEYPDRLIEPEGEGIIMVHYDSYKNVGYSQVFITVIMNTEPISMHTLIFDVNIVPEEGFNTDYEKTYETIKEEKSDAKINEMVEGDETEKGYYTDSTEKTVNY